jgi:DUF2891 family protein
MLKLIILFFAVGAPAQTLAQLSADKAVAYSQLTLKCMDQNFPYKIDHVYQDEKDIKNQKIHHPIFYGCFDWHSAVHGHWALIKLLSAMPDLPNAEEIRRRLDEHFRPDNIAGEVKYFERDSDTKRSERPYGFAWFLRLILELKKSKYPQAALWTKNLEPLEKTIRARFIEYLKVFDFPVRRGVHENSAFAMTHAYDYAKGVGDGELLQAIVEVSKKYYLNDIQCPLTYEPSGDDFISPCLTEADLMRRVLSQKEFLVWFNKFWPAMSKSETKNFFKPLVPTAVLDAKAIHLVGLDFERAWSLAGIAQALPAGDRRKKMFLEKAREHASVGDDLIKKGDYGGTHWLASFAIFFYSESNLK